MYISIKDEYIWKVQMSSIREKLLSKVKKVQQVSFSDRFSKPKMFSVNLAIFDVNHHLGFFFAFLLKIL